MVDGIVLCQVSLVRIFNGLSNEFLRDKVKMKDTPALLFCFSKTSEPNPRHRRPSSSSNWGSQLWGRWGCCSESVSYGLTPPEVLKTE